MARIIEFVDEAASKEETSLNKSRIFIFPTSRNSFFMDQTEMIVL